MNKQAKNNFLIVSGFILGIILIYSIVIISAITITQITPVGNITTSNSSQILEFNISSQGDENISDIKLSWDGTNYSFMQGLVLGMNFNNFSALGENDTRVADISGNNNWGTVVGGSNISWTPNGKYGGAFNFSGRVNYINVSQNIIKNTTQSISVTAWIKSVGNSPNTHGIVTIANNENNPLLAMYESSGGNRLVCEINNGTNVKVGDGSFSYITPNVWHFSSCVLNSDGISFINLSLYVDGILAYSNSSFSLTGATYNPNLIRIGVQKPANGRWFNGSIDDVMVYNRSLSASEISQLYKSQLTKYDTQNWSFQTNQTLTNISWINSTNPSDSFNYYLCSSNSTSSENCTSQKTITQTISNKVLTANFTSSIGNIRDDFYGVVYQANYGLSQYDNESNDDDCTLESQANYTRNRNTLLNLGIKTVRMATYLENKIYENLTMRKGISFDSDRDSLKFLFENNISVLLVIANTPTWNANTSSPYCSTDVYCPSSNLTAFADATHAYIYNVTEGDKYINLVRVQDRNEANLGSFLNNVSTDAQEKADEYVKEYNVFSSRLHEYYPSMEISAPAIGGFYLSATSNFTNANNFTYTFLRNQTGNSVIPSFNYYIGYNSEFSDIILNMYRLLTNTCDSLGVDCSRLYHTEFNYASNARSLTSWHAPTYGSEYVSVLNSEYINNISIYTYEFIGRAKNFSCSNQNGNFLMYQSYFPNYTAIYNVTKSFTHLCPAGSTVYSSNSDDSTIKTVTCKKNAQYSVIVINTDTSSKNVTLDGTSTPSSSKAYLMDISSGNLYLTNNSNSLGIMDSYDIKYLVTPNFTLSDNNNLIKKAPTGESYNSTNEINISSKTTTSSQVNYIINNALKLNLTITLNISDPCPNSISSNINSSLSFSCNSPVQITTPLIPGSNTITLSYPQPGGSGGGPTSSYNQEINVCLLVYDFIIGHYKNNSLDYSLGEFENLKYNTNLSSSEVIDYLSNYPNKCDQELPFTDYNPFPDKPVPKPEICKLVHEFILTYYTPEKNFQYTEGDLELLGLRTLLNKKQSENYLINFEDLCEEELPFVNYNPKLLTFDNKIVKSYKSFLETLKGDLKYIIISILIMVGLAWLINKYG